MNKQQVAELFRSKGFQVDELLDDVAVSLNRSISMNEVLTASDGQIEDHQLVRLASNEIGIICMDEGS